MPRAAKPGHPAAEGAGPARRIVVDLEPAAAIGQELDAFAAGPLDLDETIADQSDPAVDHGACKDDELGAGAVCEQRAAVGDGAAGHEDITAIVLVVSMIAPVPIVPPFSVTTPPAVSTSIREDAAMPTPMSAA